MAEHLLELHQVETRLRTAEGSFPAVEDVSFTIAARETVAVVGESGCAYILFIEALQSEEEIAQAAATLPVKLPGATAHAGADIQNAGVHGQSLSSGHADRHHSHGYPDTARSCGKSCARPPMAHLKDLPEISDRFSPGGGRYHFSKKTLEC